MVRPKEETDFLNVIHRELGFMAGVGYYQITPEMSLPNELTHASWIAQAQKLGAEAIFFVDDYPAVLFFKLDEILGADTTEQEEQIRQLYLKVWNTSWVPLFFIALRGEFRVYSAYQQPQQKEAWQSEERWLKRVQTITQIAELVGEFSRAEVESGRLFKRRADDFNRENRVDQCLLSNLRLLRARIEGDQREKREHVHALIGRSIFIRYLEDREILMEAYFADEDISQSGAYHCYTDVLQNKTDTYNLFRKLREDFNGDLFPLVDEEDQVITENDLEILRGFLLGQSMGEQEALFFWAYKFDIIPIELISNIYEEFYHEHSSEEDEGTHYTPTSLVDFVLTECLTTEKLDAGARVLDPACGSGIFLVEAFKRIVYHACYRKNVPRLSSSELTELLTERIAGIDINSAAIQIAAFSLYLAFLDFRDPPDIRKHKRLPRLIYDPAQPDSGKNLFAAVNAFQFTQAEHAEIQARVEQNTRYAGRAADERMLEHALLPLDNATFDVIVGNPPWGSAGGPEGQLAIQWCDAFRYPVGDKELSQAFIWRTRHLLKPGGEIGLLVLATGALFNDSSTEFRNRWLTKNRIRAVYNFAHVRHVFFRKQRKSAIAPFAVVCFTPAEREEALHNTIVYLSIKQTSFMEKLQSVVIDKSDIHKSLQRNFLKNQWLWKTYMWGGQGDVELIGELKSCYSPLSTVADHHGRGYQDGGGKRTHHTDEFEVEYELPIQNFSNNESLDRLLEPIKPRKIHALGQPIIFSGPRLLIKRGVSSQIQTRLAEQPFAFKNSIIGIRLDSLSLAHRRILFGILKSSLARYYHFLTSTAWSLWHDDIRVGEHLSLPVHLPENDELEQRILDAVERETCQDSFMPLFDEDSSNYQSAQRDLDEAIFDLYDLSEEQRDLIRDLCQITIPFFYEGQNSFAAAPPSVADLEAYRDAFLEIWQERLHTKGKGLEATIYAPVGNVLCGMVFELKALSDVISNAPVTDNAAWQQWFNRLSHSLRSEHSAGIYINKVVKELNDNSMLIIKHAEWRLWTKSQARQDAREFLAGVFQLEWQRAQEVT
ncbi:MAG: N-6 DNA methylase [Anaerolineae bacterium]|nr:N-6 DNA methylase [Anaerolineae bacterium]